MARSPTFPKDSPSITTEQGEYSSFLQVLIKPSQSSMTMSREWTVPVSKSRSS